MKLLLTSNGLANEAISEALLELVGKQAQDISLVFIPTASNVEKGDKVWLINDLINIKKQNFKSVAIADISAVPEKIWRPQIEEADVLFFEGGDTYYLMEWLNKSGVAKLLPELLKTRVYMGVSAGSMVVSPDLNIKLSRTIYGDETEKESIQGLGFADFYFLPHLNSSDFASRTESNLTQAMQEITQRKTYVLDDESALKVVDGKVEVIGGGKYLEFN